MSEPKHMQFARAELGQREISGGRHNDRILKYFNSAGHPWVKDDETAWCSAFVNFVTEQAGIRGTHSLAARSWLKWGKKVTRPQVGDVVVFWRGARNGWQGHVGFYVGETRSHIKVLGGNQSNRVSIQNYSKSRLLAYRRAPSLSGSRTVKAAGLALTAETGRQALAAEPILSAVQELTGQVQGVADMFQWAQYALIGLSVVSLGLIMWARIDDLQNRGR